jgi:hypothetical protein
MLLGEAMHAGTKAHPLHQALELDLEALLERTDHLQGCS